MKSRRRLSKKFPVNEAFISDDRMRLFKLAVVCICLCLLLIHFFTSFSYSNWFWGVNHLYFFPPFLRWSVTLLGIIICVPLIARILFQVVKKILSLISFKRLKKVDRRLWYGLMSLISFVPFWLLRSKTYFLGDGYLFIGSLDVGESLSSRRLLYSHINDYLISIFGWGAATTCAFVSCFSGVLFVFGVLLLGDFLTKDKLKRPLIWGLLFSTGAMELFFGYVEVYSLLLVGILYYILFSLYFLTHKCSLIIPAIVLMFACLAHDSATCLLPSLIYLFLLMRHNTYRRESAKGISKKALLITSILISIYVVFYGLLTLLYRHSSSILAGKIYKSLGPMSLPWNKLWFFLTGLMPIKGNALESSGSTMFSVPHLSNIMNEHILIAPVGFALCGLLIILVSWKRIVRNQVAIFLGIASVLYFLLSLTYNPLNGASRDWDVFTPAGLLYTVLAVYLLTKYIPNRKSLRYVAVILVLTSFLHTIPWILVNANEKMGLKRFQVMVNTKPHWSNLAGGYGHDELADYFYSKGKLAEAAKEEEKALKFSDNPRYFAKLSKIYHEKGLYDKAISVAEKAVGVHPKNPGLHNNLGILYEEKELYDKAMQEYKKALVIEPRFAPAHANLGRLYRNSYQQFMKYWNGDPEYKKKTEKNINRLRGIK